MDTPQLTVAYQPRDFRKMREMGASWKIITEDIPEPKGIEMWSKKQTAAPPDHGTFLAATMSEPEVLQRKHTRREFRERMQSGELKACIIPVAAIEQHLEHLAMEHDWRSVCHVAVAVAERLRPHVLVAEGLMAGISEHHMRHPGTLSLRPGTFLAVLADLIDSVVRAGFKNVLVLNGHGGNIAPSTARGISFCG